MLAYGRRAALAWYAAGRAAGCWPLQVVRGGRWLLQAVQCERPGIAGKKKKGRGGGALCVGRPGLFCCCCRPGAGLFLLFAEGVRFFT